MSHPLSRPARDLAAQRTKQINDRHRLDSRAGGQGYVRTLTQRIKRAQECETHGDGDALDVAASAAAQTIVALEAAMLEHDDAQCNDVALDRARLLLTEAALILECVANVHPHKKRIQRVRDEAASVARGLEQSARGEITPLEIPPSGEV